MAQLLEGLPAGRELAYTSVSTIVRILEQKGFVRSEKVGRGHRYSSVVAKEDYQACSLKYLVPNVFDDSPYSVVGGLIASHVVSNADRKKIRALLPRKRGKSASSLR